MDSSVALVITRGSCFPEDAGKSAQSAHLNGCVPLSHQVAGHKYGVDKVGILQHPDGTVLKQLQPPPRGPREMKFYSMVYAEDCCDSCLINLREHLPKYYGTWSSPDTPTDLYLKLEDVTRRFQKPCIMDVKIGQKSYDPFALQEKREQQIRKYPLMEEIGFLVLGMRVYKVGSDSFDTYDQHYGRGLVKDTIKEGLSKFFFNGDILRKDAITASILKVRKILQWFESQSQFNFYASSLLFVYEGICTPSLGYQTLLESHLPPKTREQNNNIDQSLSSMYSLHKKGCVRSHYQTKQDNSVWKMSVQQPNGNRSPARLKDEGRESKSEAGQEMVSDVEVKMIDFAHVFPSDVHDQGYIYGLKNLLKVLQQVLDE
ncbi:inositol polyphosphate multikinase-like isoform X1 [Myxocyprinus asiaticus]|uniref:inositol polyphosphate multikinase-like isoform X1 n=2 Tax=Myxocyprinus asiaticus TaxID=70543 RepID=UPI0022233AD2|nr:inositol polyphosphate multikinase-like isoform X1 [Myxocyprinus asiaticus]